MSQTPPAGCGRVTPRWSVAGQPLFEPALIAGLPSKSAIVSVGPPLSCSGPRTGLPVMSPFELLTVKQLSVPCRLFPASVPLLLLQSEVVVSPEALFATIVLKKLTLAASSHTPPPSPPDELPATVSLMNVTLLLVSMSRPPPSFGLLFCAIVVLVVDALPESMSTPPPSWPLGSLTLVS